MNRPLLRPRPRHQVTLRQRMTSLAILLLLLVVLPLFAGWFFIAQPGGDRNSPSSRIAAPDRLEAHVRMLTETLTPRDFGHRDNLNRVADYLCREFEAAGARVSRQPFRVQKLFEVQNVRAFFGSADLSLPRVIVGAHYDAFNDYPGADDNASGVAGLLELARLLGQVPGKDLALPIELVSWCLEEPPFFRTPEMGSAVHARRLKVQGSPVKLAISLEMIGCFSDARGSQSFPVPFLRFYYPGRGDFITVVGDFANRKAVKQIRNAMRGATVLPVHSINAPRGLPGIDFSDHANYWNQGYAALMITDTAFYRNHRYHTATDTADTLDYGRMACVVAGTCEAVLRLARKPET